ncbi:MAG TPA: HPF/RaiA family ribosome-associated protein [Burkholderiaceae bacterium]|nr:HPF/RaiA family ribosome-associated protein [Burkholderiaceae bacterium]
MKLPFQVFFHGMEPSEAVEAAARERLQKLEQLRSDIVSCRVSVELQQRHQRQGRPFGVRIDLTVPGRELAVTHTENEDVYVALRDAFDDMRRRLQALGDADRRR